MFLESFIESIRKFAPDAQVCANCVHWKKTNPAKGFYHSDYMCQHPWQRNLPTGPYAGCFLFKKNHSGKK